MTALKVLVVDLNNFARYPTIAVGYISGSLRRAGEKVTVFSPFAHGVPGLVREPKETKARHFSRRLNYALARSHTSALVSLREQVAGLRKRWTRARQKRIVTSFEKLQPEQFDIILVSTYLMYYDVCVEIGKICARLKVPLIVGGSYFSIPSTAQAWAKLPGLDRLNRRGSRIGVASHYTCRSVGPPT
jgi:anaerobic magnesium-protoporphyrin IX monomethyl ester cyclase